MQQCDVPGECTGQLITYDGSTASSNDCLKTCIDTPDCSWFTFNNETDYCGLFASCAVVERNCRECVSGEVGCPLEFCGVSGLCEGFLIHQARTTP